MKYETYRRIKRKTGEKSVDLDVKAVEITVSNQNDEVLFKKLLCVNKEGFLKLTNKLSARGIEFTIGSAPDRICLKVLNEKLEGLDSKIESAVKNVIKQSVIKK